MGVRFSDWLILRSGLMLWLAQSPVFSPLAFSLGAYKTLIYPEKAQDSYHLQERITASVVPAALEMVL